MRAISLQSSHIDIPAPTRDALQGALQEAAQDIGTILQDYPDTWGDAILRQRIDAMTPEWDGEVLMTGSATQALNLALKTVGEGKRIAINIPAYFGVLRSAQAMNMEVLTWENVAQLEAIGPVDAVLMTSNFTPPTGQSFSNSDKARIAGFARKHDAWVIEDNAYDPLWRDKFPSPVPSDPARAIRLSSLSKIVSPALRLGFIKAGPQAMNAIRSHKITMDLSSSIIPQIMARAAVTPDILKRFRDEMQTRSDVLRAALAPTGLRIPMPQGGPFVCLNLPPYAAAQAVQARLAKMGLKVDLNGHYFADGKDRPFIRLNAGGAQVDELKIAAHRITLAMTMMKHEARLAARFTKAAQSPALAGKTVLVSGGMTRESIDGVRHFANTARAEGEGHRLAAEYARQGAHVVLVTAATDIPAPKGVTVMDRTLDGAKIRSTQDMATALREAITFAAPDIAVSMAVTPTLVPAVRTGRKLKVKGGADESVTLAVCRNLDLTDVMASGAAAGTAVAGYDADGSWIVRRGGVMPEAVAQGLAKAAQKKMPVAKMESLPVIAAQERLLAGRKVIVTSGHTHEGIGTRGDIMTNFASGRQGHAVAQALAALGADVVLVTGPSRVAAPVGVRVMDVASAQELQAACLLELPADAAVCVCAVGDFRGETMSAITYGADGTALLRMVQNPDTLKTLGLHPDQRPNLVIGFAAETHDLMKYAAGKLEKKGADAICANEVGTAMVARGHDRNSVHFIARDGETVLWDDVSKGEIGLRVGREIAARLVQQAPHRQNHVARRPVPRP